MYCAGSSRAGAVVERDPQLRRELLGLAQPVRRRPRSGATTSVGVFGFFFRPSMSWAMIASACAVFPRPMSSARMPPSSFVSSQASQASPSSW